MNQKRVKLLKKISPNKSVYKRAKKMSNQANKFQKNAVIEILGKLYSKLQQTKHGKKSSGKK